jgi:hypothetical protein
MRLISPSAVPVCACRSPGPAKRFAVEQREEGLEVLLLAVVRRRRHQQEVPGALAQQLAELEPLRRLQLATEPGRAHPVRLVHDHEVELGLLDLFQQHFIPGELIHSRDEQPLLLEHALSRCGVLRAGRENLELQAELQRQLVLPLLHQPAGGHHKTGAHVVPEDQFLDIEPGHDRLARAGVVRQQEPQRRARQQLPVHRADLMRQRLHVARRHRQHRIMQPREHDALRLSSQPEIARIGIEGTAGLQVRRDLRLVLTEEHDLPERPVVVLVGHLDRVRAVHLRRQHRDGAPRHDAC